MAMFTSKTLILAALSIRLAISSVIITDDTILLPGVIINNDSAVLPGIIIEDLQVWYQSEKAVCANMA